MHAGRWCGNGCRRSPRTGPVRAGEGAVVRRTALRRPAPPRTRREGVLRGNLSPLDPARGLSPRLSAANGGQRMAPPGAPPANASEDSPLRTRTRGPAPGHPRGRACAQDRAAGDTKRLNGGYSEPSGRRSTSSLGSVPAAQPAAGWTAQRGFSWAG